MNTCISRGLVAAITLGALALPLSSQAQVYGQAGVQAGVSVNTGYAQPQAQTVYAQPQPQPVYQQPQPVYVQQQPVYVQQPVRTGGRFRIGADLGIGWMLTGGDGGGLSGVSLTGSLRLGWQLNDNFAIFYQGALPIGLAGGTINGRDYGGAAVVFSNAAMAEWTFNDFFSLGAGPALDYAAGAICSGSTCFGSAGTYFGFEARASLSLVGNSMGENTRRRGLRFGVSSHTSFLGGTIFQFFDLHIGHEWY